MKKLLVTGSNGLIGSEVVNYFDKLGWSVTGVDNNMRKEFFGDDGDTLWNQTRLLASCMNFEHHDFDIRDRQQVLELMEALKPNLIVHCAAQPSHDLAALRPLDDFGVNAMGTHNLLEAARAASPNVVFVHMSTNKVYGDRPNLIKMKEKEARWIYDDPDYADGIDESMSLDNSTHSLFGVSKAAADLLVQEYGRSFGMQTCCL
ncbi:MAG: NAD-dependent epimerase, partial [Gemmatimonadetes bacterium]|nr:NAD-dependent epimerase [Gemmatimonadota bacterium]